MLADPKARALVTNFANQWLYLRELKNANPDVTVFPDFDDNLRQAFQRETEMLFESIVREDRSVLDLLDADYTFVNERLARHYGIPNVYGPDFRRVPVPNDARRGLLGHGSLLLVTSNANRTSPVIRGKWILENLLGSRRRCRRPTCRRSRRNRRPEPRRSANASSSTGRIRRAPDATRSWTRSGWRSRTSTRSAAGARPTRASRSTPPRSSWTARAINGPASLRKALLNRQDAFVTAMTEKLLMYGVGRETKYYDMPAVRAVMRDAARSRYRFSDLVSGIVKSAPFQMRVTDVVHDNSRKAD